MSYPLLLATGLGARTANVTNTVGILTSYIGGAFGFRDHLRSQRARLRELAPVALGGGVAGALLLLLTSESSFKAVVPVLILGVVLDDPLPGVNSIRGILSLLVNAIAAVMFAFFAGVDWGAAGILSITCLIGGYAGARVSLRMPDHVLRIVVIAFGLAAVGRLLTT